MQAHLQDDAITAWLHELRAGEVQAAEKLWQRFSEQLVRLARRKLSGHDRVIADEEDVALSAFDSFCRGIAGGRYPQLNDRHNLWRLLITITLHKVLRRVRDDGRLKRGGGFKRAGGELDPAAAVNELISKEPSPELAAEVAERCRQLMALLPDPELVQLVMWKLEGFTNEEIAGQWGRSERTVERKLALIRKIWSAAVPSP